MSLAAWEELDHGPAAWPAPGDWADRAACKGRTDLFFSSQGGSVLSSQAAKAICAGCPVREDCFEFALDAPEALEGVWGGESRAGRKRIKARMRKRQYRARMRAEREAS